jgi:hypothetical protein
MHGLLNFAGVNIETIVADDRTRATILSLRPSAASPATVEKAA